MTRVDDMVVSDDDQMDGGAVVVAVYSIFFKQAESCYP